MRFSSGICLSSGFGLAIVIAITGVAVAANGPHEEALQSARQHIRARGASLGHTADDLEDLVVTDVYVTPRTGTTHVYLRQQRHGIDIHRSECAVAVDARGAVRFVGDRLVRAGQAHAIASLGGPLISAEEALEAAARHLGLTPTLPIRAIGGAGGRHQEVVFAPSGLSKLEIPGKRVYLAIGADIRISWNFSIYTMDGDHWWNLYVDASTGEVLRQHDWVRWDTYNVYPIPFMNPDETPRALIANVADPVASRYGWHDTNELAGADSSLTLGTNVFASEDIDGDDGVGAVFVDGGPPLAFDFPVDLELQPANYADASVVNLFYWVNIAHDVMYRYGFDEPAGAFQANNYSEGLYAKDPVIADAQDGAGVNNARFATPPDNLSPRMEMFVWLHPTPPSLVVSAPPAVAGGYAVGPARFGGGTFGLAGSVVQALDAADVAGPTSTDGCSPLTNAPDVSGNLAIIDRGDCLFIEKVANAQAAGAVGVIIVNNAGDETLSMAGVDPSITIPAVFVGQSDGQTIAAEMAVEAELISPPARDGAFDAGVVIHEYGHGVSARLTGGPTNVDCLSLPQSDGMAEGWSDFFALAFTAMSSDQRTDPRAIGAYLVDHPDGVRNYPYSTDLGVNPLTYGDIATLNRPHGVGEVWAAALWEMYWELIDKNGFDPDLYEGEGGNNLALQFVIDALKLQPCEPTFVDGRDALLAADQIATGGVNNCAIWESFAKRGVGEGADDGGSASALDVSESFEVPVACPEPSGIVLSVAALAALAGLTRRREGARTTR